MSLCDWFKRKRRYDVAITVRRCDNDRFVSRCVVSLTARSADHASDLALRGFYHPGYVSWGIRSVVQHRGY
jgi:hypothetical protein